MATLRYGATPEDWATFDLVLGLTEDLLPCVVEPGLAIAPNSTLTTYGKTPSIVIEGGVCGLTQWTQRQTTGAQIATWMADPRLGICLQTRRYRALDIDVPDLAESASIRLFLRTRYPGIPLRTRADSAKCLALIQVDGLLAKQTLQTRHGLLELLANGQQCLVAGTHKDGARYQWSSHNGAHPRTPPDSRLFTIDQVQWDRIPLLDELDLECLQEELRGLFAKPGARWTEGRIRKTRVLGGETGETDPVVEFLKKNGWVRS